MRDNGYMFHQFNVSIARQYGLIAAIFLDNILFSLANPKETECYFYKGEYWVDYSLGSYVYLFPYLTIREIKKGINKCVRPKILIKRNFVNSYGDEMEKEEKDWYSLTDFGYKLFNLQKPKLIEI